MEKALTLLDAAIIFATKAHSGMTRKGTNVPYIVHPIEAAAIVSTMTDDEEVIAAAVLHDVLEDTEATEDDLLARFGRRITELVIGESENKRRNFPAALTWKIRKQETITFLETEADTDAKMLALADKLAVSGREKPRLYAWCGTEDFLYQGNRRAWEHVKRLGYDLCCSESAGDHQWKYWDEKIKDVLHWWLGTDAVLE